MLSKMTIPLMLEKRIRVFKERGFKLAHIPSAVAAPKLSQLCGLGTMTHVLTRHPVVAMTFDDGPHSDYTPRLLDILARYQAHATFFMVGEVAQKYPALVRQVAQLGHTIGNHSWDHRSFPLLSARARREQIRNCAMVLAPYAQRLFRPPYGEESLASRFDALWLRYRIVGWNLDAEDWRAHDAAYMVNRLMQRLKPGSIVLFHDAIHRTRQPVPQYNREQTLTTISLLLKHLAGRFRFVTIPELVRYGRPQYAGCK